MNKEISIELQRLLLDKGIDMPVIATIAEVVMWLYEKHEIWVQVSVSRYGKFYCNVLKKENTKSLNNPTSWEMQVQLNDFNSPTEAYEAAIKYTLEKLI